MKTAATAVFAATALILAPTAAMAATTTTTSASVPATTITTSAPGSSSTGLQLAPRAPNLASGRAALTAYATYLQALVDSEATSQTGVTDYLNTIESGSGCKSALEPLTQGANEVSPAVQNTLTSLGREIGDDLAISYDTVALAPLAKLASALGRLKWVHGGHNAGLITAYLTAETNLITLPQSPLCHDVLLAAASKPVVTPSGTRTFLKTYARSVDAASNSLSDFLTLLRAYETTAEQPLVTRITVLAAEFAKDSKADLLSSGQQLTTSLETT